MMVWDEFNQRHVSESQDGFDKRAAARNSLFSGEKEPGVEPPDWRAQKIRIEALRAAARVVSGFAANPNASGNIDASYTPEATIVLAEHFAAWLETGER